VPGRNVSFSCKIRHNRLARTEGQSSKRYEIHDRVFRGPYSAVRRVGVCKVVKTLPPSMVLGVDEDEIACPAIQVQSM
jgi:hypothetical protein